MKINIIEVVGNLIALHGARLCAFIVAVLFARVSGALGASAKPVANSSGATDSVSTAVTKAIQRTLNPGQMVTELLTNKGTPDDRKVYLLVNADRTHFRALMFAATAVDATVLSGETLVGTLTRADTTKESGQFSYVAEEGITGAAQEAHVRLLSITSPFIVEASTAFLQPSRSMESLINAIVDALEGDRLDDELAEVEQPAGAFAVVMDQTSTGNIKVFTGATAGTLTGVLSDIETVAEETASVTSLW